MLGFSPLGARPLGAPALSFPPAAVAIVGVSPLPGLVSIGRIARTLFLTGRGNLPALTVSARITHPYAWNPVPPASETWTDAPGSDDVWTPVPKNPEIWS